MPDGPDYLTGSLVAGGLLAVLALVAALWRVAPGERLVIRRAGRVRAVAGPGLRLVVPLLDRTERVRVGPQQADLWCRAVSHDGVVALARARATFQVTDPDRYAVAPDAALDGACRAAEHVLRGFVTGHDLADLRWPGGRSGDLAARVPETDGLTATDLELLDLEVALRDQPPHRDGEVRGREEELWN